MPPPSTDTLTRYPTVEHRSQACKAQSARDHDAGARQSAPAGTERLGRQLHMRGDWGRVKFELMYEALLAGLVASLFVQRFWRRTTAPCRGVTSRPRVGARRTAAGLEGTSRLGFLLQRVRSEVTASAAPQTSLELWRARDGPERARRPADPLVKSRGVV